MKLKYDVENLDSKFKTIESKLKIKHKMSNKLLRFGYFLQCETKSLRVNAQPSSCLLKFTLSASLPVNPEWINVTRVLFLLICSNSHGVVKKDNNIIENPN